jgi:hypothetical protein
VTPKSKLETMMPLKSAPKVLPRGGSAGIGEAAIVSDSTLPSRQAHSSQAKALDNRPD